MLKRAVLHDCGISWAALLIFLDFLEATYETVLISLRTV